MKTVLIYRSELLPISETFIRAQTGALREFAPRFAGLARVERSLPLDSDPILLTPDTSIVSRLRSRLYIRTGIAPAFHRRIAAAHPKLIHAHFGVDGAVVLPMAERLNLPLVVTLHGYDLTVKDEFHKSTADGSIYLKRRPKLWQRASKFVCISDFIRRKAVEVGFPEEKLLVHYIGIDLSQFAPATAPRQQNLVLFVGRLVEKKGCGHLIRAMKEVRESLPPAELVVIGDGPLRAQLEELARGLAVNCKFLGPQPSNVIREWLGRAKVFSAPSVIAPSGDAEGLGIVFCEAQAIGTPVVSFESGGIPEVVRHKETGLLAPEGDDHTLAQYLLRYLTDDEFWRSSSERAVAWVRERFDLAHQTRELEEIYAEVAAPR